MVTQIIQTILLAGTALLGSLLPALYFFQEKIIYLPNIPSRTYHQNPSHYRLGFISVEIVTEDDVKLHAWLITQPGSDAKRSPTFIYFHGNAGNISHRLHDARFYHTHGFNLLMVSYRGYGQSQGSPSEKGFRLDANAALQYIRDRDDLVDTSRIFIFGRSIGAACAIALAAAAPTGAVRGLVLENTFTSIDDMIDAVMPFLKFAKPFNRNKWDSLRAIRDIEVPILFISGMKDELVPPAHMKALRENAVKTPFTSLYTVEDGGHNDTWQVGGAGYRSAIGDFVERVERDVCVDDRADN